ncbi:MAG TPA: UDP-N-acetylmuramoyl-tripeptide--D-alanyl-D-alanine ligase [Marmoricola sp.]|nr:UDP-N-acetylmuramoyl-tripeptide--D-alanyl-D-alanine ligase [Marmoricola sp.]
MIPVTLGRIAEVTGGRVHDAGPDLVVSGPAFLDSRSPEPGGLFAAFVGEHADGHAHAVAAVDGGAAAVLGSRPTGAPTVVVDDVQAALQQLARVVLAELRRAGHPLVLALTGSQGKTSTKDLLAAVLGAHAPTVATHGSFNNELGLPLTVLRATSATRFLVLEMGARGIGHLRDLCDIAPPDVSLVLNVGKAHLGEFGSQENIALAKGELVEALGPDGVAVLNADDPLVAAMATRTRAHVLGFGRAAGADVRLDDVVVDELGRPSFTLAHGGQSVRVSMQLLGGHQAANAAAATSAAIAAGLPLADVATVLESVATLSPMRMELHERSDGLVVVNDAYNANPDSMRAALEALATMGARSGRRTVAVLGEMRELGRASAAEHAQVGLVARRLGIDLVVTVGEEARPLDAGVRGAEGDTPGHAYWAGTVEEALAWLRHNVSGSDLLLVKASRGARLERVADGLLSHDADRKEAGA